MTEDKIKDIQAMIQMSLAMRMIGNLIGVLNSFPLEDCQNSIKIGHEVLGQEHRTGESIKMAEEIIELTLNTIGNYREGLRQIISQDPAAFFNAINNDRLMDLLKKTDIDKDIIH